MIGLKLLTENGASLNSSGYGSVTYPLGEWVEVPGQGAYIALNGGLSSGGTGPILCAFECEEQLNLDGTEPNGVRRFRRVRRLSGVPSEAPLRAYTRAVAVAEQAYEEAIGPVNTAEWAIDEAVGPARQAFDKAVATAWAELAKAARGGGEGTR